MPVARILSMMSSPICYPCPAAQNTTWTHATKKTHERKHEEGGGWGVVGGDMKSMMMMMMMMLLLLLFVVCCVLCVLCVLCWLHISIVGFIQKSELQLYVRFVHAESILTQQRPEYSRYAN